MSELSIYFFKKLAKKYRICSIPLPNSSDVLEKLIEDEIYRFNQSVAKDYFQVYNKHLDEQVYFTIQKDNVNDRLKDLVGEIILNNTSIESISDFKPKKNARDPFPFDAFAVFKKEVDGKFTIGFENMPPSLKLYKKNFLLLNLGNEYNLSYPDSTFLIPTYTSILIEGNWNVDNIEVTNVALRNKSSLFFESLFDYKDHWKLKAHQIVAQNELLNIENQIWEEYNRDIRNIRKFVRTFNTEKMETALPHIKEYCSNEKLKKKLGFTINDEEDNVTITIISTNDLKNFIDAYLKNITQPPLQSESETFYRTPAKEKL